MTPDGDEQPITQQIVRGFLLGEIVRAPWRAQRRAVTDSTPSTDSGQLKDDLFLRHASDWHDDHGGRYIPRRRSAERHR